MNMEKEYNYYWNTGWVCPVCGKGVSPYVTVCPCCPAKYTFTWGSGTENTTGGVTYYGKGE